MRHTRFESESDSLSHSDEQYAARTRMQVPSYERALLSRTLFVWRFVLVASDTITTVPSVTRTYITMVFYIVSSLVLRAGLIGSSQMMKERSRWLKWHMPECITEFKWPLRVLLRRDCVYESPAHCTTYTSRFWPNRSEEDLIPALVTGS